MNTGQTWASNQLPTRAFKPQPRPANARQDGLTMPIHGPGMLSARLSSLLAPPARGLTLLIALMLLGITTGRAEPGTRETQTHPDIAQTMSADEPSPPLAPPSSHGIDITETPIPWFLMDSPWVHATMLMAYVLFLAFFFAKVEIHIEGPHGWAQALPTWRVEKHPLLDIFWGSRPLTGYHAWVFAFMALSFHLTIFVTGKFELKQEARILGCLMIFWIVEDFLWFVMNPAYGIRKFRRELVWWHKKWFLGMPADYVTFTLAGTVLFIWSFR